MEVNMSDFGKFIGGFGESFLKTLQSERERMRKEQEFNQEMSFRTRQMNLMNSIYQQRQDLDVAQENRARELDEYEIRENYQEIPNSFTGVGSLPLGMLAGGQSGEQLNKPFDNVLNPFEKGKFYLPKQDPQKQGTLTNFRIGDDGNVWGWNPNTNEFERTNLKAPEKDVKNPKQTEGGDEEPKLSESGAKGLANIKNPNFVRDSKYMTPDEAKQHLSQNLQSLTKDLLGSRASNWFYNIVNAWGRVPTGDELDREILKHAEGENKTLTPVEVEQLNRLSEYLDDASEGLKRYNYYPEYIKKLSSKK